MPKYQIHITDMLGREGFFEGPAELIDRIEGALYQSGARFHISTECWDYGFYSKDGADAYDAKRGAPINSDPAEQTSTKAA